MVQFNNSWDILLKDEFQKPYYLNLRKFLVQEYKTQTIYPNMNDIFNALKYTDYKDVKVVMLGQDPYHEEGQAHGMCFSVLPGVDVPPSLKNIYKEIEAKTTCFGIHKETFQININDKDAQKYSSHGQQKSAVVALKLAVVDYLKSKEKEAIIILDDVFGELDIERQESLIKELDNKGQVFISTTDITNISDNILLKGKIIEMDEGD